MNTPAQQATLQANINATKEPHRQQTQEEDRPKSLWDKITNAAAQTGAAVGGLAKGTIKTAASGPMVVEAAKNKISNKVGKDKIESPAARIVGGALKSISPAIGAAADAHIAIQKGAAKIWGGETPVQTGARQLNAKVDNWSNSWVPEPQTGAAEFTRKAANATGEAIPGVALAVGTGGMSASTALIGNAPSYAAGAANAFSTEMLEGSGKMSDAVISGAAEYTASAIGGAAMKALSKPLSKAPMLVRGVADATMEGLENVGSGFSRSTLTGENYTRSQMLEEFALGATVGVAIGGGVTGINTVTGGVTRARIQGEVNSRIADTAKADVADVKALLARSNESAANAIVAQDSLSALQKQVANPVNTLQSTTAIPADLAKKYNLTPAGESGNPLSIDVKSYESRVDPKVSQLTGAEVPLSERAAINPTSAGAEVLSNPRALYQYAQDIYLHPGIDVTNSVFTYRGQANQFYRTSLDAGSMPASGVGTSWEGSGIYSAKTPYTTDMYGPSGKLADNPYSNRGIKQKAVDAEYPVGVVLQQPAKLTERASPQRMTDAPGDVVPAGERRVRYDDKGLNRITEVVNNPADIKVSGLVFGRTGVADASPIQYANSNSQLTSSQTSSTAIQNSTQKGAQSRPPSGRPMSRDNSSNAVSKAPEATRVGPDSPTKPAAPIESSRTDGSTWYALPNLVDANTAVRNTNVTENIKRGEASEMAGESSTHRTGAESQPIRSAASESVSNSWGDAMVGRASPSRRLESEATYMRAPESPRSAESANEYTTPLASETPRSSEYTPERTPREAIPTTTHENTPGYSSPLERAPEYSNTPSTERPPLPLSPQERPSTHTPPEQTQTTTLPPGRQPVRPPEEIPSRRGSPERPTPTEIWTPLARKNSSVALAKFDEDLPQYDFNLVRGPGSRGLVHETDNYNRAVGGLSSY